MDIDCTVREDTNTQTNVCIPELHHQLFWKDSKQVHISYILSALSSRQRSLQRPRENQGSQLLAQIDFLDCYLCLFIIVDIQGLKFLNRHRICIEREKQTEFFIKKHFCRLCPWCHLLCVLLKKKCNKPVKQLWYRYNRKVFLNVC